MIRSFITWVKTTVTCPGCQGTGQVRGGKTCPTCKGKGTVTADI